jgi:hypothetical protein
MVIFFYHLDALFGPTPDGSLCFALPDTLPVRLLTRGKEEKGEGGKGEKKEKRKKKGKKKVYCVLSWPPLQFSRIIDRMD